MRAAVFIDADHPLSVEEVDPVEPGPEDVVVRLTASGVCHTDLGKANGHFPFPPGILGHEGVGVVESVGREVSALAVGDRVLGAVMPTCGTCWFCVHDHPHLCVMGTAFMSMPRAKRSDGTALVTTNGLGTFAETMTAWQHSLVKVETDLPDDQLSLVGCGITTGVSAVLEAAGVPAGSSVVVIGCGGVGQAVVQTARLAGAEQIIAVDPVAWKRELAVSLGATDVVDPMHDDVAEHVRSCTAGRGADFAFDVVGHESTIRQSVTVLRRGGSAVLIGVPDVRQDLAIPSSAFIDGKRVICTVYGDAHVRRDFPLIVSLVERGKLELAPLVTQTIDLDQINEAFHAMKTGSVIRSVIKLPS